MIKTAFWARMHKSLYPGNERVAYSVLSQDGTFGADNEARQLVQWVRQSGFDGGAGSALSDRCSRMPKEIFSSSLRNNRNTCYSLMHIDVTGRLTNKCNPSAKVLVMRAYSNLTCTIELDRACADVSSKYCYMGVIACKKSGGRKLTFSSRKLYASAQVHGLPQVQLFAMGMSTSTSVTGCY